MPVPRLFEASGDPREQWSHILSTLLALGGPDTRTALVKELSGEELPGADADPGARAAPAERRSWARGHRRPRRRLDAGGPDQPGLRRRRGRAAAGGARGPRGGQGPPHPRLPDAGPARARGARRGGRRRMDRAPPELAAGARLGAGAPRARRRGRHRPDAAPRGRVLLHPPGRRAVPAGGADAAGPGRAAPGPRDDLLRPQRAVAGAADPVRGRRGARGLPAHRRPGRRDPAPGRRAHPAAHRRPRGRPGLRRRGRGAPDAGDRLGRGWRTARSWVFMAARSLLPARR